MNRHTIAAFVCFGLYVVLCAVLMLVASAYCILWGLCHLAKRAFLLMFVAPYSPKARCKYDMHDYYDSDLNAPLHMVNHYCVRCGKEFQI